VTVSAVLDTNVVVSALLRPSGNPALLLNAGCNGRFEMLVSPAILAEYDEVLGRAKFGFSPAAVREALDAIRASAKVVRPREALTVTSDPADNIFLECAVEGRAMFVVTGNLRHFPSRYREINVVSPRDFLSRIGPESE